MIPNNLYPFQPKKISIGGNALSYIDEGEGHSVVMLHGNPTWSFYYRNLASALKKRFRVIVPDHMGCGLSDKPQNYSYCLENHIANLETLLDQVKGQITLIVHDWGGAIGFGYAGRHANRIKSLVVLNTGAFRSSHIPFRINICRVPFLGALLVRGLNGFAFPATFMASKSGLSPEVKKAYLAPYSSWHDRVAIHKFVKDIPLSENHLSWKTLVEVEDNLSKLSDKPMLILWGGQDFCFNDLFYNEWCQRFPKAEKKYFDNAGHYVLEDAYSEVELLIEQFLSRRQ